MSDFLNLPAELLGSLERCTSNPLRRITSTCSCTSQEGGATFVPFGPGQQEYIEASGATTFDFDEINAILESRKGEQKQPNSPPITQVTHAQPIPTMPPIQAMPTPVIVANAPNIITAPLRPQSPPTPPFMVPSLVAQNRPETTPPQRPQRTSKRFAKNTRTNSNPKNRNSKNSLKRMEIREIIKQNLSLHTLLSNDLICKCLRDQNGSRFIQDKLIKNKDTKLIGIVLNHIIFDRKQILELSEDIFGNYVIQILFDICSAEQVQTLVDELLVSNVYRLTHSLYGCRVIQKALDTIPKSESIRLVSEMSQLSRDLINKSIVGPNSNHVIQKILTLDLSVKHFDFIIQCIDQNISFYASHIFGCRIVQNLIKLRKGKPAQNRILHSIINNDKLMIQLCKSEYGNYVIQDIINYNSKNPKIITCVKQGIFKNILFLSRNKFGSNVVEKCLVIASVKDIDGLLNKLLVKGSGNGKKGSILVEMIQDKFANYVIQKLLNIATHKQQSRIIYFIQKNVPNLKGLKYGKHIMDKIKKITKSDYHQYYY